jgi:hypothetical protein
VGPRNFGALANCSHHAAPTSVTLAILARTSLGGDVGNANCIDLTFERALVAGE